MRLLATLILATLFGTASVATGAEAQPTRLVCYDDVFIPYFMIDAKGFSGLSVDILNEAARRIGYVIEYRQMPFKRIESELAHASSGSGVECAFGFTRLARREEFMEFGHVPLQHTEYVLFVRSEAGGIASLADLQGKTIGVRSGFRLPEVLNQGIASGRFQVAEVNTDQINFQKLSLKRIDAVLTDATVGQYVLRQMNMSGIKRLAPSLERYETYVVFAKNMRSAQLASAFDKALDSMIQDGTMERLTSPYQQRQ